MKKVFVDTSGWLAVLVSSDSHHGDAVEIYLGLLSSGCGLVVHDGILLELGNALAREKTRRMAADLYASISNSERIEVVALRPELLSAGWKLFSERLDKDWGIVDCVSFVMMKQLNIDEALTADRHFEQAGFKKLL